MTIWSQKLVIVYMIELVKSPSTQVLSKGRFALWLALLVFATLLFAAGAQAQETTAPEGAAETPTGEAPTTSGAPAEVPSVVEQPQPAVEEAPPAAEQAPPVVEQAPPTAEQTPPAAEEAPPAAEEAPPAAEQAPPAAEQAPSAAEEAPSAAEEAPPVIVQAPPLAEEAPTVVEQAPPAAEEAPPVIEKKAVNRPPAGSPLKRAPKGPSTPGDSQVPAGDSGPTHEDRRRSAPETPIASTASVVPGFSSEISTRRAGPGTARPVVANGLGTPRLGRRAASRHRLLRATPVVGWTSPPFVSLGHHFRRRRRLLYRDRRRYARQQPKRWL